MTPHADTKNVVILGTGGTSIDIYDLVQDINNDVGRIDYRCVGFATDDVQEFGRDIYGVRVIGPITEIGGLVDAWFVNGIGSPKSYQKKPDIIERVNAPADRWLTLIHPTAHVSRHAVIGLGTVIFPHVTICANVIIGDHVVVLPNSVISHDATIGDYCCVAGGVCVSGNVTVRRAAYLGTNCCIREGVSVESDAMIGMGAVILKDVYCGQVMVGNPARLLKE